jgi:hypothetical protein
MFAVLICTITGFAIGFLQSLLVGIYAKSWAGGTGLLWGLIVGAIAMVASMIVGWGGIYVATIFPIVIGILSAIFIARDQFRP